MKMDTEQFLLCKLAEEASEITKRALKAQQFGLKEIQPGQSLSNEERLLGEIRDLVGVIRALHKSDSSFYYHGTPQEVAAQKISKIKKFAEYSVKCGTIGNQVVKDIEDILISIGD